MIDSSGTESRGYLDETGFLYYQAVFNFVESGNGRQ